MDLAKSDDGCLLLWPKGSEAVARARGEFDIAPLMSSCLRARGLLVECLKLRLGLRGSLGDGNPNVIPGLVGEMTAEDWQVDELTGTDAEDLSIEQCCKSD